MNMRARLSFIMKNMEAINNSIIVISVDTLLQRLSSLKSIGLLGCALGSDNTISNAQSRIIANIKFLDKCSVNNGSITENPKKAPTEYIKHNKKLGACQPPVNIRNIPKKTIKIRVDGSVPKIKDISRMHVQVKVRSIII